MVFDTPQDFEAYSGEVDIKWNCNRRILFFKPRIYNSYLNEEVMKMFALFNDLDETINL